MQTSSAQRDVRNNLRFEISQIQERIAQLQELIKNPPAAPEAIIISNPLEHQRDIFTLLSVQRATPQTQSITETLSTVDKRILAAGAILLGLAIL
jgi:hypothetical protein